MPTGREAVPPTRVPALASVLHPRRDRVCTLVFVVVLSIMGLAAFRPRAVTTLEVENRTLAPWPAWSTARGFAPAFEQAFADRFGGRETLLKFHNRAQVRLFGVPAAPNVTIGRDRWLYFLGEDGTAFDRFYRSALPVSDAQLHDVVAELSRRRALLASHGIAYVVLIAPDKSTVYPEYLPSWATKLSARTPLDRLIDAIHADGSLRFVDVREPLRAAKTRERVYFQTDSHWNLLGAAVAYRALMHEVADALAPRAVEIAPVALPAYVPGVDVYRGDLARLTGDPQWFAEPDYAPLGKVLASPQSRCAKRTDAETHNGFEWYACDRVGLPTAIMYRDSMAIPLIPLLAENFGRSAYVSSRLLDPGFVLRERPDIVIEEMVERSILVPAASPMPQPPAR